MGTGYSRQDTANNIANNKVIDAADLDDEFDALEAAFNNSTGHTHDGTSEEGGPITVTGPNQEYVSTASEFRPKTDDTYDLGSATFQWKDLHVDGTANIDSLVADSADIDGGTIDNTTIGGTTPAAGNFTNVTVTGTVDGRDIASDGTKLDTIETNADVTDTANVTAAGALMDSELTDIAAVKALDQGVATTDSPTFAGLTASTADINGGTIDGTTIGGTTPAAGNFTNVTVTGTVDGRDIASDGTKLDTIETNADVTDTANVTAAGALMDSELTDIAAVKALDQGVATTDSPTFAGLTASTADINGGTITGITDLAVGDGGTGASTAADARTNLGVSYSSEAQAEAGSDNSTVMTPLRTAQAIAALAVPTGTVLWFAAETPPSGWLECDGSAISRTTYAALFAVIGTTYGAGDGSTTFNICDLRGEFIRGWDNGRGVNSGRSFGSAEADALENHRHQALTLSSGGSSGTSDTLARASSGTLDDKFRTGLPVFGGDGSYDSGTVGSSTETRPRNIALLPIIKY